MEPMTPSAGLSIVKRVWAGATRVFAYGRQIATLEARVAALEEKLGKQPPDACNKCGERAMRVFHVSNIKGGAHHWREDDWKCEKCGHQERRVVNF
jgi:hypothetical protein